MDIIKLENIGNGVKKMGKTTKISTFDSTWNPVVGCLHNCAYCYARRIAERFAGYDKDDSLNKYSFGVVGSKGKTLYEVDRPMTRKTKDGETETAVYPFGFVPTLFNYKMTELRQWKEPKDIFVCSMSDLFGDWVTDEWIKRVFIACERYPQHRYFFLTKNPDRYADMYNKKLLPMRDNFWYGTTITHAHQKCFYANNVNSFLSIEPIQEFLDVGLGSFGFIDWVIIGAETGNRKGKVKPEREWIDNIVETANLTQIPVFMKDSLKTLMGKDFRQEKPGR